MRPDEKGGQRGRGAGGLRHHRRSVLYAEPPLQCYVFASCSGAQAPTLQLAASKPRRQGRGRMSLFQVLVSTPEGGAAESVPGATARVAGHAGLTSTTGRVTFRLSLAPGAAGTVAARRGLARGSPGRRQPLRAIAPMQPLACAEPGAMKLGRRRKR